MVRVFGLGSKSGVSKAHEVGEQLVKWVFEAVAEFSLKANHVGYSDSFVLIVLAEVDPRVVFLFFPGVGSDGHLSVNQVVGHCDNGGEVTELCGSEFLQLLVAAEHVVAAELLVLFLVDAGLVKLLRDAEVDQREF